jgi:hypothetical protein
MDRIRFAINATETAQQPGEQLREAGADASGTFNDSAAGERRFQTDGG